LQIALRYDTLAWTQGDFLESEILTKKRLVAIVRHSNQRHCIPILSLIANKNISVYLIYRKYSIHGSKRQNISFQKCLDQKI